jgi:hypothetical protein
VTAFEAGTLMAMRKRTDDALQRSTIDKVIDGYDKAQAARRASGA